MQFSNANLFVVMLVFFTFARGLSLPLHERDNLRPDNEDGVMKPSSPYYNDGGAMTDAPIVVNSSSLSYDDEGAMIDAPIVANSSSPSEAISNLTGAITNGVTCVTKLVTAVPGILTGLLGGLQLRGESQLGGDPQASKACTEGCEKSEKSGTQGGSFEALSDGIRCLVDATTKGVSALTGLPSALTSVLGGLNLGDAGGGMKVSNETGT